MQMPQARHALKSDKSDCDPRNRLLALTPANRLDSVSSILYDLSVFTTYSSQYVWPYANLTAPTAYLPQFSQPTSIPLYTYREAKKSPQQSTNYGEEKDHDRDQALCYTG
jgi:hypothetical protein